MKTLLLLLQLYCMPFSAICWGFYGHQKINYYATFLLPPELLLFYKNHVGFISEHAVDPDKRRYAIADEGPRHYIDIDRYGVYPYPNLPRKWSDALNKFGKDSLMANGIVPWHIQVMLNRLTLAFKEKDFGKILKNSAEIGHYIADAHVPLHANSNHNGQYSNQKGIHGFWESRLPELFEETRYDLFIGHAVYLKNPERFIWNRVLESALAADSVLQIEKQLTQQFSPDKKYAFEPRNGIIMRQYSSAFSMAFDRALNGMVERRMRQSIFAIASFWYTAWINAGQPNLQSIMQQQLSPEDVHALEMLNETWKAGTKMMGKEED